MRQKPSFTVLLQYLSVFLFGMLFLSLLEELKPAYHMTEERIHQKYEQFFKRPSEKLSIESKESSQGVSIPKQDKLNREPVNTFKKDFDCLVEALYHEARGEPPEGVLAVSMVILNRVKSPRYPDSVCEVVYHQLVKGVYQFSYLHKKELLKKPFKKKSYEYVKNIAEYSIRMHNKNVDTTKGSMYYFNPSKVSPKWARSDKLALVWDYGNHRFYRRIK